MHDKTKRVLELRAQGRSYQDIALELGIAPSTACEYAQAGIKAPVEE